jgi:hypothetical protein
MPVMRRARLAMTALAVMGTAARAQVPAGAEPIGQPRSVAGLVQHPGADSTPAPVPHQLVVLHRVGRDTAGPIDSAYTDARGAYHFQYKTSGMPGAVYFASTTFDGIAYFTDPLQTAQVASPDADIMVFDTTSHGVTLQMEGRHIVIAAPGPDGRRQMAEVFDLDNQRMKTLVARDTTTPLWTTRLPDGAVGAAVSGGDVTPAAVHFAGSTVQLYSPMSPGVRQLAVEFEVPARDFPLTLPLAGGAGVLEVMLEEASAVPQMPGLAQQASVTSEGRTFKRYLAQDVPDGAVLRIDAGSASGSSRTRLLAGLAFLLAIVMAVALTIAIRRGRTPQAVPAGRAPVAPVLVGVSKSESLLFQLAQLDAAVARHGSPPGTRTAQQEAARSALKAQIAEALAEEGHRP